MRLLALGARIEHMFEMLLDGLPPVPTRSADDQVDPIEAIVARERLIARLQAEQAEQVKQLADQHAPLGGSRGVAAEVALARGVSSAGAANRPDPLRCPVRCSRVTRRRW